MAASKVVEKQEEKSEEAKKPVRRNTRKNSTLKEKENAVLIPAIDNKYLCDYERFEVPDSDGKYIELEQYKLDDCTRHIFLLMHQVEISSFKIGCILNYVYRRYSSSFSTFNSKYNNGYSDIYDYALKNFGISRGSCNNFMNVCKRFTTNIIDIKTGNVILLDKYKDFGMSQLIQFLPYDNKDVDFEIELQNILPSDSVRTIKEKMSCGHVPVKTKKAMSVKKLTETIPECHVNTEGNTEEINVGIVKSDDSENSIADVIHEADIFDSEVNAEHESDNDKHSFTKKESELGKEETVIISIMSKPVQAGNVNLCIGEIKSMLRAGYVVKIIAEK